VKTHPIDDLLWFVGVCAVVLLAITGVVTWVALANAALTAIEAGP
jgi:cytochrome b subunit of formate dehydrogenase